MMLAYRYSEGTLYYSDAWDFIGAPGLETEWNTNRHDCDHRFNLQILDWSCNDYFHRALVLNLKTEELAYYDLSCPG